MSAIFKRICCNDECGWIGYTGRMIGSIGPVCMSCGDTTEPLIEKRIGDRWLEDEHAPLVNLLDKWCATKLHTSARIAAWNAIEKYLVEHLS